MATLKVGTYQSEESKRLVSWLDCQRAAHSSLKESNLVLPLKSKTLRRD